MIYDVAGIAKPVRKFRKRTIPGREETAPKNVMWDIKKGTWPHHACGKWGRGWHCTPNVEMARSFPSTSCLARFAKFWNCFPTEPVFSCVPALERRELEEELLNISSREQRRIGQDLRDGLCQQLIGIEFRNSVLVQQLQNAPPLKPRQPKSVSRFAKSRARRECSLGVFHRFKSKRTD